MIENEDQLIVEQLKEGKEVAFHAIFKKYYSSLTLFAYKIVKDEDVARDIVQNLFAKLYEQRATIEIRISLKSFLYQSVRNHSINEINSRKIRQKHHDIILLQTDDSSVQGDELMEQAEMEMKVVQAVAKLPTQCKRIFEMSRFEGLTNGEIADSLNLSKRTVETQISKALKSLRDQLSDLLPIISLIILKLFN